MQSVQSIQLQEEADYNTLSTQSPVSLISEITPQELEFLTLEELHEGHTFDMLLHKYGGYKGFASVLKTCITMGLPDDPVELEKRKELGTTDVVFEPTAYRMDVLVDILQTVFYVILTINGALASNSRVILLGTGCLFGVAVSRFVKMQNSFIKKTYRHYNEPFTVIRSGAKKKVPIKDLRIGDLVLCSTRHERSFAPKGPETFFYDKQAQKIIRVSRQRQYIFCISSSPHYTRFGHSYAVNPHGGQISGLVIQFYTCGSTIVKNKQTKQLLWHYLVRTICFRCFLFLVFLFLMTRLYTSINLQTYILDLPCLFLTLLGNFMSLALVQDHNHTQKVGFDKNYQSTKWCQSLSETHSYRLISVGLSILILNWLGYQYKVDWVSVGWLFMFYNLEYVILLCENQEPDKNFYIYYQQIGVWRGLYFFFFAVLCLEILSKDIAPGYFFICSFIWTIFMINSYYQTYYDLTPPNRKHFFMSLCILVPLLLSPVFGLGRLRQFGCLQAIWYMAYSYFVCVHCPQVSYKHATSPRRNIID